MGLPAPPATEGGVCARAAFDLSLGPDGQVQEESLRLLVWEDDARDPYARIRLQARALASRWETRAASSQDGEAGQPGAARAILRLDCGRTASASPVSAWKGFESHLQEALRMRQLAVEHLRHTSGAPWSEHDLDCLWSELGSWRRGPFLHDEVEGWQGLEPRLRVLQERDGGFWVCRAARSSHMGQFVFLDTEGRVLAVARYWLGE